jgi:HAMP domain-containing protein
MSQAFVVEVTEKPELTPAGSIEGLAKAFNISTRKIELMLKRLPGVATKPISQQEAAVVVTYFEQAGLKAAIKSITVSSSPSASVMTSAGAMTSDVTPSATATTLPASDLVKTLSPESSSSEIAKARLGTAMTDLAKTEDFAETEVATAERPEAEPVSEPTQDKGAKSQTDPSSNPQISFAETRGTTAPGEKPASPPIAERGLNDFDFAPLLKPASVPPQPLYSQVAPGSRSTPYTSTQTPPPTHETRPEHDILRTTLIGEPDPRKTQIGLETKLGSKIQAGTEVSGSSELSGFTKQPTSTRLANRILLTALLPTLLTLLGALVVTYLMVQPVLYEHLQSSARHPAAAIAASLSSVLTATPEGDIDYAKLQGSIEATRTAFEGQALHFIAVTDTAGNFLPASWFESSTFMTGLDVRDTIREQVSSLLKEGVSRASFVPFSAGEITTTRGTSQLEVIAEPLRHQGQTVGAIVVGASSSSARSDIWRILGSVALFSLIPLALASLLAILAMRPVTRRVQYLSQRANDISRGNLAESVELKGKDELSELAEALERLRVSMQNALERLRRRR